MSIWFPKQPEESDSGIYPVYTRSGWEMPQLEKNEIEAKKKSFLYSPETWTAMLIEKYTNLAIRSKSAYPYNCLGMVFASRRVWIEGNLGEIHFDLVKKIFVEDGYSEISRTKVNLGDVVVYQNGNGEAHVGIIFEISPVGDTKDIKVVSKWGILPEFIHPIEPVPDLIGKPVAFYTDRIV